MSSQDINDPLLDHSYDGIQEYDNPLPGWWVMIFWVSIIFAIPYTIYVHFMEGNTIQAQYEKDMADNTLNLNLEADAATILAMSNDPDKLALVAGSFGTLCAACHKPDGSGQMGLGPNLTDKHWKNAKKLTDIFDVISNGVPTTAMAAQRGLDKDQRVLMAAYVVSLSRELKEGLPPEGEEILSWPSETE
ncbi:MAG: cbb3-type cytochrome c oxidase N-terminal domain-containing protein [Planctomycetota bacterium]|nr:cbb3-type cytochrome c oxidase N-terminal domain-containing protein [Planctomycetota bacterium]